MRLEKLEGQTVADRFQLKEMIGKGGYGAVFEAIQLSVGRRCAVKILLPGRGDDDAVEERFRAEGRATSRLTHPNSLVLYDFGVDEATGHLFLATEFLDGKTLHQILKQRETLSVWHAVSVLEQVAGSLHDAHSQDLVHRDIKPKNIMVIERAGQGDFVKVIDFGIAKVLGGDLQGDEELTKTGMLVGTPQYMAPEQLLGSNIDGRTDQYAMALVGYRMLIGRNPFRAGAPMETALRHLNDRPLPLTTYRPELDVSPEFENVFLRALEKAQEDRFDNVMDFVSALRESVGNPPDAEDSRDLLTPISPRDAQKATLILDSVDEDEDEVEEKDDETPATQNLLSSAPDESAELEADEDVTPEVASPNTSTLATGDLIFEDVEEKAALAPPPIKSEEKREDEAVEDELAIKIAEEHVEPEPVVVPRVDQSTTGEIEAASTSSNPEQGSMPKWVLAMVLGSVLLFGGTALAIVFSGAPEDVDRSAEVVEIDEEVSATEEPEMAEDDGGEERLEMVRAAVEEGFVQVEGAFRAATAGAQERFEELEAAAAEEERMRRARQPAEVSVTLIPWGTLYVGERSHSDATRQVVELSAGRHELTLRQEGEVRARQTVDVGPGESKMVVLEAQFEN